MLLNILYLERMIANINTTAFIPPAKEVPMTPVHIIGVQFSVFTRAAQFCCEEIGLPYSLGSEYEGKEFGLRSPALKTLNPFSKVPVLIDQGRILYETHAICRYLDSHYNQSHLQPGDAWQRAQMDQWCGVIANYVDKSIVRNFLLEFRLPRGENGSVRNDVVAAAMPEILNIVKILEAQLADQPFLLGEQLTLADIMLMPSLHYLSIAPHNQELLKIDSSLRTYVKNILERPSAKKVFLQS